MRIVIVVGARPNFMKAAPLVRELQSRAAAAPLLVHTGQHYDAQMSQVFFEELGLPPPRSLAGHRRRHPRGADRPHHDCLRAVAARP